MLAPDGPFTITSAVAVRVDVTDFLQTGEWYTAFAGTDTSGPVLWTTPEVPFDSAGSNTNLDQTFADPRYSSGSFLLDAGTHTFTVRQNDPLPGYNVWNLGIRATAQAVPEPSSLASAALGLASLAEYAGWRRVRHVQPSGDRRANGSHVGGMIGA